MRDNEEKGAKRQRRGGGGGGAGKARLRDLLPFDLERFLVEGVNIASREGVCAHEDALLHFCSQATAAGALVHALYALCLQQHVQVLVNKN